MRVAFPFVGDSIGGSQRSVLELYKELEIKGYATPLLVLHKMGPLSSLLDEMSIGYYYLPVKCMAGETPYLSKIILCILRNFFTIRRFIRDNEINIVHGNDLRVNLTWPLTTKLSGVKYVWHQRSLMSTSLLWVFAVVLADHFITISSYVHITLPSNISPEKKTLVLNPFKIKKLYNKLESRDWLNKLYSIPTKSILFGYIGRLVEWKNIDFLIRCFIEYSKHCQHSCHLIIVGTGDKRHIKYLKNIVCESIGSKVITFAGFNSSHLKVISAFDVMLAPSNKEPFGRTLVESMLQKTPVLAAKGGGHDEIVKSGITGLTYVHNNIESFIEKCHIYTKNTKLKQTIITKAYNNALVKYSSSEHCDSVFNIYQRIIK